jgi:hypothetical protein
MSDIQSLKAILNELDQLFDREDDVNDLFDISKMRREIATNSQQNVRDAKELIKGTCGSEQLPSCGRTKYHLCSDEHSGRTKRR